MKKIFYILSMFCLFSISAYGDDYKNVVIQITMPSIRLHPIVGVLLPASPYTYTQFTTVMSGIKNYHEGIFTFTTGYIDGVPIVLSTPPPIGNTPLDAIDTYLMGKVFKPDLVIGPGTSGSHLPDLSFGDVVIGARIVNFSNYMTTRDGKIIPGEFNSLVSDHEGYRLGIPNHEYLYSDPNLVKLAESAALKVAKSTPGNILSAPLGRRPWIMTYGTQGSGAEWLRDPKQIKRSTKVFHEVDEAGSFSQALVLSLQKIPFVQINGISDAALNVPTKINHYFHDCSEYAQKRANLITLEMIKMISQNRSLVPNKFRGGFSNPWPEVLYMKAMVPPDYVQLWTRRYGVKR